MLTRIAAFNSIAVFLDQLAIILISLALTPTIISVMGVSAFGIWQLIVRGTSYVSLTDGRPHELLKWQIARGDGVSDSTNKEHFGAGLIVWSSYLPFMMVCAGRMYWPLGALYGMSSTGMKNSKSPPLNACMKSVIEVCATIRICTLASFSMTALALALSTLKCIIAQAKFCSSLGTCTLTVYSMLSKTASSFCSWRGATLKRLSSDGMLMTSKSLEKIR